MTGEGGPFSFDIKVKIQSLTAPVATHKLAVVDLQDESGDLCLNQLQDAILNLAASGDTGGPDLKLALSYLDGDGDLIPLTSQEGLEHAVERHSAARGGANKNKSLLLFAQAMQQHHLVTTSSNKDMDKSNLEQRLSGIEAMLMGPRLPHATPDCSEDGSQGLVEEPITSTHSHSPPRNNKDYTALVRDRKASLASRLNKVKQMNSACNSPARPVSQDTLQEILKKLDEQDDKLEHIQQVLVGRIRSSSSASLDSKESEISRPPSPSSQVSSELVNTMQLLFSSIQQRLDDFEEHLLTKTNGSSSNTNGNDNAASAQNLMLATNMINQRLDSLEKQIQNSNNGTENNNSNNSALEQKVGAIQKQIKELQRQPTNDVPSSHIKNSDALADNVMVSRIAALSTEMQDRLDGVQTQISTLPSGSNSSGSADRVLMLVNNMVQQRISALSGTLDQRFDVLEDQILKLPNNGSSGEMLVLVDNLVQQRVSTLKDHVDSVVANSPPPPPSSSSSSPDKVLMDVNNLVQQKISALQQHIDHQFSNFPPPSSENQTPSSSDQILMVNDMVQQKISALQEHIDAVVSKQPPPPTSDQVLMVVDNLVQQRITSLQKHLDGRMDTLAQSVQLPQQTSQSRALPEINAKALPTSSHPPSSSLAQLQEKLDYSFQHLDSRLTKQILTSQDKILSGRAQLVQEIARKISTMVDSSQATILKNEKQYASALRQTMVRLHNETRNHVVSVSNNNGRTSSTIPSSSNDSYSWESVKKEILSSSDELRKSQQQNHLSLQHHLVECIEVAQKAIVTKMVSCTVSESALSEEISEFEQKLSTHVEQVQAQATAAVLDRLEQLPRGDGLLDSEGLHDPTATTAGVSVTSRDLSLSGTGNGGEGGREGLAVAAVAVEQMEAILLAAMEKLELAMESNCEHIQAQAVAVILDRVENIQGAIGDKLEASQNMVLDKIVTSQGMLLDKADTSQNALSSKLDATHSFLKAMEEDLQTEIKKQQSPPPALGRQHTPSLRRQQTPPARRPRRPSQTYSIRGPPSPKPAQSNQGRDRELGEFKYNEDLNMSISTSRANAGMHSMMSVSRGNNYTADEFPDRSRRHHSEESGGAEIMQRFHDMENRTYQLQQAREAIMGPNRSPSRQAALSEEKKVPGDPKMKAMMASAYTGATPYSSVYHQ